MVESLTPMQVLINDDERKVQMEPPPRDLTKEEVDRLVEDLQNAWNPDDQYGGKMEKWWNEVLLYLGFEKDTRLEKLPDEFVFFTGPRDKLAEKVCTSMRGEIYLSINDPEYLKRMLLDYKRIIQKHLA